MGKKNRKKDNNKSDKTKKTINGLKYLGEIKNGVPHGHGTYFYNSGNKLFEGEFIEGKEHGHGTSFDEDRNKRYEGEFQNNKYHGYGILYIKGRS